MPPCEKERLDIQKAMAYDLPRLLEKEADKTYTYKERKELIDAYITGAQQ